MKIGIKDNRKMFPISQFRVGETFTAPRKSTKEKEDGYYMIVDRNSGVILYGGKNIIAINLESGQLRKFDACDMVCPIKLKVIEEN